MQGEIIQQAASTATSPWLSPSFLLPLILAAIGFIAWLVRLEYKTNATGSRQKEFEVETAEEFKDVRTETKDSLKEIVTELKEERLEHREWKKQFYAHATDTRTHHNEEMFKEFKNGLERRFTSIDTTLQQISRKLDRSPGLRTEE